MDSKRNYKGLKKYEALLKTICCVDDYYQLTEREWEGCLGVACVISYIEGAAPNMFSLSKNLDIPHYNIHLQRAFERLRINGILSKRFGAYDDPALTGSARDSLFQKAADVERNAWCAIAGIASGYTGMREEEIEKDLESESFDDKLELVND